MVLRKLMKLHLNVQPRRACALRFKEQYKISTVHEALALRKVYNEVNFTFVRTQTRIPKFIDSAGEENINSNKGDELQSMQVLPT